MNGWTSYTNDSWVFLYLVSLVRVHSNCVLEASYYVCAGMESTFQDYKSFSETVITEESVPTYIRARQKLDTFQPFEDKLVCFHFQFLLAFYIE